MSHWRASSPMWSGGSLGTFARAMMPTFPIFALTLLHFSHGRAIRVVGAIALLPIVFAGIYLIDPVESARIFLSDLFQEFITPTILPLATLILATGALGDEVEDRTMVYLVLKPVSRLRIVLEKYVAVIAATVLLLWIGFVLTWIISGRSVVFDGTDVLLAGLIAILWGVLAYGAVFMTVSLLVPRALLAGIVYILLWETLLSRLIPGARVLSLRHYVNSIFVRIVNDPRISVDDSFQLYSAVAVILVIIIVTTLLTTARLRRMDLE
jgi:ABC-2 type transport system permease protein